MLYQKGEKLKELRQTIKDIPKLSELKESDFVMSKSELKKFQAPILKLFNKLNTVLFSTLINKKTQDENRDAVYNAVKPIIYYIEENYEHDLKSYFYEEKLAVYEKMFVCLVRDELYKRFPEYRNILNAIPEVYWKNTTKLETNFPKISHLIDVHHEISEDIESNLYTSTITYLEHSLEMIYEEISELIKIECKTAYLNPDVLPNNLRQLIYLIKSKLPIVFKEDAQE